VTLAAEPFDTAEAANAWCVTQALAPGDCFAKRLSHSDGPSGNTRPR
jgi:serine/threonine-protein kinase